MSEICLDCFSKEEGRKIPTSKVILDEDLCEVCGQVKPCIVRYRRPLERLRYVLGLPDPWDNDDEDE